VLTGSADAHQFSVEGSVVWVTGASRGIGAAIARSIAAGGGRLVLQARTSDDLEALADELGEYTDDLEVVAGSVTDTEAIERAVTRALERWGRLDGLVAAAGVSPIFTRAEHITEEDWRRIIDVNLTGTFLTATAAGRAMLDAKRGSIVLVSSVHGMSAVPRLAAYAASKGAVNMLTRSLASEWSPSGVRVNAIAPGYVETDMTSALRDSERWGPWLRDRVPLGRFAHADEIAGAARFLLSPAASYITGAIVDIDGGWSAQ
jgi:NAD(P)-dependent dehydrogenase (short-subunit alcohol dehydrogenase family)